MGTCLLRTYSSLLIVFDFSTTVTLPASSPSWRLSISILTLTQHCTWQPSTLCLHHRCDGRKLCLQRRLLKSKGQHAEWNYLHPKCRDDSQVSAVEVSVPTDAIETERWGAIPRCCVLDSDELLRHCVLDVDKLVRPTISFTPFESSRKKTLVILDKTDSQIQISRYFKKSIDKISCNIKFYYQFLEFGVTFSIRKHLLLFEKISNSIL